MQIPPFVSLCKYMASGHMSEHTLAIISDPFFLQYVDNYRTWKTFSFCWTEPGYFGLPLAPTGGDETELSSKYCNGIKCLLERLWLES